MRDDATHKDVADERDKKEEMPVGLSSSIQNVVITKSCMKQYFNYYMNL